ncbi:MAG: indole-3-glycerol phosphate synthase TrpC [Chitinophagaceae bacterium]
MDILEQIIKYKKTEVAKRKAERSIQALEKTELFKRETLSLKLSLLDKAKTGIIAEFKRKSPSKGNINVDADVVKVTKGYTENGASGLSVLTDEKFFGGSDGDLIKARVNDIPLLRKEFIIDEYQLAEAKSIGADVILLIAACLLPGEVKKLSKFAKNLGLEVLLELHAEEEIGHICDDAGLIGINNRNLKTFEVDIERSLRMAEMIPAEKIKVAESGISSVENIELFKKNGFHGFLIGETFMKQPDPTIAFAEFVKPLYLKKV